MEEKPNGFNKMHNRQKERDKVILLVQLKWREEKENKSLNYNYLMKHSTKEDDLSTSTCLKIIMGKFIDSLQ